jgi:hypothetical protein
MPFALLFIGMVLVVTGVRNTYKQLGTMVVADMTGKSGGAGFIMFFAALFAVGAIGALSPQARTFSHYFMALIIISLLLHNATFAQRLIAALRGTRAPATTAATTSNSALTQSFAGTPASGNIVPATGLGLGAPSSGVLQ